jgi:signal transduction histidine kinase
VTLTFARDLFQLSVRDDGKGIDLQSAQSALLSGHWGLAGMRERAQRIGARLEVYAPPQGGVIVTVTLSAGAAYGPAARSTWAQHLMGPRRKSTGA